MFYLRLLNFVEINDNFIEIIVKIIQNDWNLKKSELIQRIGNIIDSSFYGIIFNESYNNLAQFLPAKGGYSSLLHGKVVDMLYFPLLNSHYPDWLPIWGGKHFIFFRPVFNIADAGISVGILMILLFYRKIFN